MPPEAPVVPAGRKARTRVALLAAAGEMFAAQGIEATSVHDIAGRAGTSIGALYLHFGSKEALALAFIEDAVGSVESRLEQARLASSPLQRVLGAGDAYLRFSFENPAVFRFIAARAMQRPQGTRADLAMGQRLLDRTQKALIALAGDLKAAMDAGEIMRVPLDEAMVFLWGAWNGVAGMVNRQDSLAIPPELAERSLTLGRRLVAQALGATQPTLRADAA